MDVQVTRLPIGTPPPRPSRLRRWIFGFAQGMGTPIRGLKYLLKHPTLWPYAVLPMLINLVISLLVIVGLIFAGYYFARRMLTWAVFSTPWWGPIYSVGAVILVIAACLSLAAGLYLLVGGILTGYFNERLGRRVELQLGTPASDMVEVPFKYQVVDGIIDFTVIFITAILCLALNCIPIIGSILGATISLYVDCYVFGYDYLDIPMALRGMRRKEKRAFVRRHRPQVLGLGATVFLMNFIPIIGSVFLTTTAVGGVLLYRQLRETDESPAQ